MPLKQVFNTHEMFSKVITEKTQLKFLHAVKYVEHFLEVMLKLETELKLRPSGLEELKKVVPEPKFSVSSSIATSTTA